MSQPLEPLQQATLTIAGCNLHAVLLPDGQPAVVFVTLCEALALKSSSQVRRVRAHPVLTEALVGARLETAGGLQVANVLIAWGIPLWLAGIRLASVKPGTRQLLIIFQKEVITTLYQHFFAPPTTALPEPSHSLSPWQAVHTALTDLEAVLNADTQAVRSQLTALETRIGAARAVDEYHPVSLERLLAATIARVLEHERRLNSLKVRAAPQVKQRASRGAQRRKARRLVQ